MPELDNIAHEQFAREYMRDFNATQAGVRCGYAETYGRELVRNPAVKARIQELRDELTEATDITAERIARAHAEIAFYDGRYLAHVLDSLSDEGVTLTERLEALPRHITAPIRKLSKRVDNKGVTYIAEAYDRHKSLDVLEARYWRTEGADDQLITESEALRQTDIPDMSEDNTPDDVHTDLSDYSDSDVKLGALDDELGNTPKWRK